MHEFIFVAPRLSAFRARSIRLHSLRSVIKSEALLRSPRLAAPAWLTGLSLVILAG
jgi:hypothetical protein